MDANTSPCLMELLRNIFGGNIIISPATPAPPAPPIQSPYNTYPPWDNPTDTTEDLLIPPTPPPTCPPCVSPTAVICPECTTLPEVPCPTLPPAPPAPVITFGSSLPCGTFLQYDIANSSVVVSNGFSAGIYKDGTQAYVGMGINYGCANEYNCSGRIAVTGSRGVYTSCQNGVLDPYATRFLVAHPDLHWVSKPGQTLTANTGLVSVKSTNQFLFFFGRANLTINGQTHTVVSKVFTSGVMLYSDGTTAGYKQTSNIEILSC